MGDLKAAGINERRWGNFDFSQRVPAYYNVMIDLHTHTLFSDGELIPAELARRAAVAGCRVIAITDHMDMSNMDFIIPSIVRAAEQLAGQADVEIIPGAELTHVPPALISDLVKKARDLGARIVVVHGETLAEPVIPGTNRAGIEGGADIISHPGLISMEDALLAAEKGVALEITARKGHSLSNGHVAKMAMASGARMVINTDAHSPGDLIDRQRAADLLRGAGIPEEGIETVFANSQSLVDSAGRR
jgi:histidinol phosphatase-like PHP family hydrolase